MFCPNCGQENASGAKTCETCGTDLTKVAGIQPTSQPEVVTDYAEKPNIEYAGFWRRFAAYIIDSLLLSIVSWIFIIPAIIALRDASYTTLVLMVIIGNILVLVLQWLYFALMEASLKQAMLGKMALGIIITGEAGNRISFGRATGRHFAEYLSQLTIYIGYIMIAFTRKKQGLHDLIAATLVVKKK